MVRDQLVLALQRMDLKTATRLADLLLELARSSPRVSAFVTKILAP